MPFSSAASPRKHFVPFEALLLRPSHTLSLSIIPKEREAKSVDEYAKELNQWLKKMRCTGVTGVRLESFVDIKIGISEEPLDPSSPSLEPYPHLWKEKFTYKGYKDECGRLKGKAFIELENGDTISGS